MKISLQPLRIPAGWSIDFNQFYEIDPNPKSISEEDRGWVFKEDMLQMFYSRSNRLLDLGWYPDGDLVLGHYGLVLYEGDFRGVFLHQFETKDRISLVSEIERILQAVSNDQM